MALTDEQIIDAICPFYAERHIARAAVEISADEYRAIESASTAPLLERIAELEKDCDRLETYWNRCLADCKNIAELERQLEEARKDAERYRWIRKQHWSENLIGVVVRPKEQTILGSLLPCGSLLDDTVDHMKSTQKDTQKGQS